MTQTSTFKITAKQNRGLRRVFEDMTQESLVKDVSNFHVLAADLGKFEIDVGHNLPSKRLAYPRG